MFMCDCDYILKISECLLILFRFHTSVTQLLPDSEMGKENMRKNKQIC